MRWICILALASTGLANEGEALKEFAIARKDPVSEAGRGRMMLAIERIGKQGAAKSLAALGNFIRESDEAGERLLRELGAVKKVGAVAFKLADTLGRELEQLEHRRQSGTSGLDAEIEERAAKARRARDEFEAVKAKASAIGKTYEQHQATRRACAGASVEIIGRLPADEVAAGAGALRAELDVAAEQQSLLLIWILRKAKRPEASAVLLEVFSHPKSVQPVRVGAASAIAALGDLDSIGELIDRLEKSPMKDQSRILHAFSLAARKRIASLGAAKAWIAAARNE